MVSSGMCVSFFFLFSFCLVGRWVTDAGECVSFAIHLMAHWLEYVRKNLWKWCFSDSSPMAQMPPRESFALSVVMFDRQWFYHSKFGSYLFKFVHSIDGNVSVHGDCACVCVCGFERVCSLAIQLSRFNRNRENELSKYCCFQCIVMEWIWYKCFMPFNGVAVKRKLTNILIVFIKSIVNRKKNQIKRKLTKDLLTRLLARIKFEWHKVNVTHKPYWIYKSNK